MRGHIGHRCRDPDFSEFGMNPPSCEPRAVTPEKFARVHCMPQSSVTKPRRKLTLLAAAGLAAATVSACDSPPSAPGVNPRQVTVFGSGQVQGVPDTLTADVGIEFTAPDVTAAMNQTNDRQQAVINALTGAGVDHKDISTTEVTLQPQFSNPGPNGTAAITGYRATNAITVKIHPPDAASRMLALIVGTGGDATRIKSVSYSIADDSQLVKDARARRSTTPRTAPSSTHSCPGSDWARCCRFRRRPNRRRRGRRRRRRCRARSRWNRASRR